MADLQVFDEIVMFVRVLQLGDQMAEVSQKSQRNGGVADVNGLLGDGEIVNVPQPNDLFVNVVLGQHIVADQVMEAWIDFGQIE